MGHQCHLPTITRRRSTQGALAGSMRKLHPVYNGKQLRCRPQIAVVDINKIHRSSAIH